MGLLTLIYGPMATCVQNNFWKEERGVEEWGGVKGSPLSESRAKTLTPLGQKLNYSVYSVILHVEPCPVSWYKLYSEFISGRWLCAFNNLAICLFLFQSSMHPEKITSPLTFLPVCDVSLHSLLLSHLQMLFLSNGTENTAE